MNAFADSVIELIETLPVYVGVTDTVSDGVKVVSVMERDSVVLNTGVTKIQRDDQITWRFIEKDALVAKIDKTAGIFSTYVTM